MLHILLMLVPNTLHILLMLLPNFVVFKLCWPIQPHRAIPAIDAFTTLRIVLARLPTNVLGFLPNCLG